LAALPRPERAPRQPGRQGNRDVQQVAGGVVRHATPA